MSVNRVTLLGNVGKDPEVKTFSNGGMIVNFSLATSKSWKDKDGQWQSKASWHNIQVSGEERCKTIIKNVKKGSKLYLEGEIDYVQAKDDTKKIFTTIKVDSFKFLDSKKKEEAEEQEEDFGSDEIPF